jgi:pimeloyl-ACP methyl ester carboxylesterase
VNTQSTQLLGQRIEYRFVQSAAHSAGDLVMLHEGLGSSAMWKDFPERLAAASDCRVLVYSRQGYGQSEALTAPRAVDYMHVEARVVLPALLAQLGVRRPVLFGHSDGGSIALIHAGESGANLRGVIALAPHLFVEDLTVSSIAATRTHYGDGKLRAALARYHADPDSAFWGWNNIWLDPAFRHWNIEALLPGIRCPILAIQGLDDQYGTLEQLDRLQHHIASSQVLTLPHCGHSPHRDQPEAVLAATQRFLQTHD